MVTVNQIFDGDLTLNFAEYKLQISKYEIYP